MISHAYARTECPKCGHECRIRIESDGSGALVETPLDPCEHQRKKLGICKACHRTVDGKIGYTIWCAAHRLESVRKSGREYRLREYQNPEVRAALAEKKRRERAERGEEINARRRERAKQTRAARLARERAKRKWNDPAYQEKLAKQRAYYHADPERKERILVKQRERDRLRRARERAEREAARDRRAA